MGPKQAKLWYLVLRLLLHARQAIEQRKLTVYLADNSAERAFLMDVRQGKLDFKASAQSAVLC